MSMRMPSLVGRGIRQRCRPFGQPPDIPIPQTPYPVPLRLTPRFGVQISLSWLVIPAFNFAEIGQPPGYVISSVVRFHGVTERDSVLIDVKEIESVAY